MKPVLPWLSIVCLLAAVAKGPAAQAKAPADCAPKQVASAEVAIGREAVLVPVEYHEQRLWMLLDLGEPISLLSSAVTAALHLPTEPNELDIRVDQAKITHVARVDSLKIGSYRIARREFYIDPRASASKPQPADPANPGLPVFGSLGMGELWPVDLELDLARHRFNLYEPNQCARPPVEWGDRYRQTPIGVNELGNILFPLELDGTRVAAGLSTQGRRTVMHTDVSRQLFGFDEHSPDVEVQPDETGGTHAYFRAMTLSSGDLRFSNLLVHLTPGPTTCRLSNTGRFGNVPEYEGINGNLCFGVYPVVLGVDAIEHLKLYIALREKTLYFAPAEP